MYPARPYGFMPRPPFPRGRGLPFLPRGLPRFPPRGRGFPLHPGFPPRRMVPYEQLHVPAPAFEPPFIPQEESFLEPELGFDEYEEYDESFGPEFEFDASGPNQLLPDFDEYQYEAEDEFDEFGQALMMGGLGPEIFLDGAQVPALHPQAFPLNRFMGGPPRRLMGSMGLQPSLENEAPEAYYESEMPTEQMVEKPLLNEEIDFSRDVEFDANGRIKNPVRNVGNLMAIKPRLAGLVDAAKEGKTGPDKAIIECHRMMFTVSLPANILNKCFINACFVCGIQLNTPVQAESHYTGELHKIGVVSLLAYYKQKQNEAERKKRAAAALARARGEDVNSVKVENGGQEGQQKTNGDVVEKNSDTNTAKVTTLKGVKLADKNFNDDDLYCKTCKISFSSAVHAKQHYEGKNHQRALQGLPPLRGNVMFDRNTGKWTRRPNDAFSIASKLKTAAASRPIVAGNSVSNAAGGTGSAIPGVVRTATGAQSKSISSSFVNFVKGGEISQFTVSPATSTAAASNAFTSNYIITRNQNQLFCTICNVTLIGQEHLKQHIIGNKHQLAMAQHQVRK